MRCLRSIRPVSVAAKATDPGPVQEMPQNPRTWSIAAYPAASTSTNSASSLAVTRMNASL